MKSGAVQKTEDEKIAMARADAMSPDEKTINFLKETIEALPDNEVLMPMETDSQAVQSHKMSLNVRFQSAYHKTKNLYGDNVEALVKQYLLREIKPPSKEISDLVKEMRMKMIGAGLMPKEAAEESVSSPAPASERAPEPAPAPALRLRLRLQSRRNPTNPRLLPLLSRISSQNQKVHHLQSKR